jgi:monoamine oxidase
MQYVDTDFLIVGAGLAGLHCALRLVNKYPKALIKIAELYNYTGGRVVSYTPKDYPTVRWENGAGRIHKSHTLVRKYIRRYKLTEIPLPSQESWIDSLTLQSKENPWPHVAKLIEEVLVHVSPTMLATRTIEEVLTTLFGSFKAQALLQYFSYTSELTTMRADVAIESITNELQSSAEFFVVKEGLSTLISCMKNELESKGVEFLFGHRLTGVSMQPREVTAAHFQLVNQPTKPKRRITTKSLILAIHSDALSKVPPFTNAPTLKKLKMEPLLRTYAIFPSKDGKSWFSDLDKTVTDSPLRFIIPLNPAKGVIMSSYTDGRDTQHWLSLLAKKGEKGLCKEIVKELRLLFPNKDIPEPLFFKAHPWYQGCTYWLPGMYDPEEASEKIMLPLPLKYPNTYVCGESYSQKQAWMEGALEHAEGMLKKYLLNR